MKLQNMPKVFSMVEENFKDLKEFSDRFRMGQLSLLDHLAKIEAFFAEREPWIKAFVPEDHRFGRLRREIVELESRFPNPLSRPSLYGILVGVKDIFHVDGFPTSAGSRVPPAVLRGTEAKAVTLLKSAGALILGKTVTTEFAYSAPGPTCNPHNLEHTPGGSSSGSAASVAAGFCPLALGTQTGGSLIRPASYCGVVGFKPSYGRIPVEGVIPLAPSMDHVGYFTTDVESAIRVAEILCMNWTLVSKVVQPVFAVPEGPYLENAGEEGLSHFRQTCHRLSEAGFEIRSVKMLKNIKELIEQSKTLLAGEAAMVHREWFEGYSTYYHQKTGDLIKRGQAIKSDVLAACRASQDRFRNEILTTMKRYNVSVLLAPAAVGPAPLGLENTGDAVMNRPWSFVGLPSLSIPSRKSEKGLPMGLQMIGPWMGDEILLEGARQITKYFDHKVLP